MVVLIITRYSTELVVTRFGSNEVSTRNVWDVLKYWSKTWRMCSFQGIILLSLARHMTVCEKNESIRTNQIKVSSWYFQHAFGKWFGKWQNEVMYKSRLKGRVWVAGEYIQKGRKVIKQRSSDGTGIQIRLLMGLFDVHKKYVYRWLLHRVVPLAQIEKLTWTISTE